MKSFKEIFTNTGPKPLFKKKTQMQKRILGKNYKYIVKENYKNKNKVFYVIRRSPGSGMFSNVNYVINHLKVCDQYNFIPIIDMENFTTIYNEREKINNTYNAWEYYFEKLNKYTLNEVYKSQNVILTSQFYQDNMETDIYKKDYFKYLKKIKIKKKFYKKANNFFKKNFSNNDNILGVHFRGSTYKTARGHAYPSTTPEMIKNISNLIKKYKYNKIFLVTEELNYLKSLKKEFGKKLFFYDTFRMKNIDSFKIYPRKKHRYKLGEENIIEAILLSKCNGLTYIKSNIATYAKCLSSKKINNHEIFLGYNSRNKYISRWKWYLKLYFPLFFGKLKIIDKSKYNI
tara:strand:+ start:249 stop:1280 length:1032 start_codon:yes stop_codon:yes gene_type:complete